MNRPSESKLLVKDDVASFLPKLLRKNRCTEKPVRHAFAYAFKAFQVTRKFDDIGTGKLLMG